MSKKAADDSTGNTHGEVHPHTVSIPFKAFARKPTGRESYENPDRNLHVFSSAENPRRENRERLGACPLQEIRRSQEATAEAILWKVELATM